MRSPEHVTHRRPSTVTGWWLAVAALVLPPASLALLRVFPQYDVVFQSVHVHLVVVGAISACAVGVALAAALAAQRTSQGPLVLLALGCVTVGALMLAHGLTTPGVFGRPANLWVARLPVLAIAAFAVCLAAAARPPSGWLLTSASRSPRAVLVGVGGVVTGLAALVTIRPGAWIGATPFELEGLVRSVLLVASALVLLGTGAVHARRWQLNHQWVQLALVVAAWQGVGAALSLWLGDPWHLAWWDYHAFLFAGFAAAVWAIVLGTWQRQTVQDVLGSVFSTDPLEHIEQGYSDALRVLVGAVEARDRYTHGHSLRVASWSVRIGQRLGLRAGQLRHLAEGAFLHDVGKIGIPDEILNKPSALTDHERAWIEQHPALGVDIAGRAPSLGRALSMIRHHHERFDGAGYPDGLAGEQIPLLARIVAVADVWDALTSSRAYRVAWEPSRALAHMVAGRGTHFDPRCFDALRELLAEEGVTAGDEVGDAGLARQAASACHHHEAGHAVGHGAGPGQDRVHE